MDRFTCTVTDCPCGTVTLLGDGVTTAPSWPPFVATLRLYVASTDPVFVNVIAFWSV
jgi:hypothetical protein